VDNSPHLPAEAVAALAEYLDRLDAALPNGCAGVYLTGSAALGDWQPGRSDLDILVITDALPDTDVDALAELHGALSGRPYLDAVYVRSDQLGAESAGPGCPHAVDGEFHRDGLQPDPVLWATLDRHAPTLRGRPAAELGAAPDPEFLRAWNRENLASYWARSAAQVRTLLADRAPDSPLAADRMAWLLLGPGRLHHTIATGGLLSKTGAADHTAALLPRYAELLGRAKSWRLGDESVAFTATDGLAAADLIDAVIAAAL
jgi:hypothetical protein